MKTNTTASEKSKILLRTYLTSLLCMMLCVTMLLGTTYAWFTSEVTTAGNEIQVGTMRVDLTDANNKSLANVGGLFGSGSVKWEPGATQIETVKVINYGDLAFDYALYLSTLNTNAGDLATVGKYIDVYITTNGATAKSAQDLKDSWIRVGTLAEVARNGYMLANGSCTTPASEGGDVLDTVKIALHMPAEVTETSIMGKKITNLGIKLMATQKVYEADVFGPGYDLAAPTDIFAANYNELAAAVTAGQSVRLTADITIPENAKLTVASGKNVVIDMNGYDITGTSTGTSGNKALFLVKGNLTIKGQKNTVATAAEGETVDPYKSVITYTHTEGNMGWGAMTAIFDITAGGVVTLADVKAVNAGGSDMNFVAHLNNWGTASLYMDGSHLEAPYCAVRVFNSGNDMNNVVARDTTIKAENRALWVHNYIGDLDTSKHTDEAVKARLNISIYNGNNKIEGDIRYGFKDTVFHVLDGAGFSRAMGKDPAGIVLEHDVNLGDATFAIEKDKTFTLDLNGHNITATQKPGADVGTAVAVFTVKSGANMVVNGEGNVQLATEDKDNGNISIAIFRNEGNLTLNGGSYKVTDSSVPANLPDPKWLITTIVDTCTGSGEATTTINDGTYQVVGASVNMFRNFPTGTGATTNLVINDGTFLKNPEKTTYIWNHQGSAAHTSTMTFNGGTYDGILCEDYHGNDDVKIATGIDGLTIYNGQ